MSTGLKFAKFAGVVLLCLGSFISLSADSAHTQHKTTKKPQLPPLPPLPSGPLGPVPQVPLDSISPVAPQVSYQNGQLTIVAPNSTLGDILRAVKKQTGAEIEIPVATDRVVTHLGPGPVREVMADLLNGSRFNYVLLGSADDSNLLTHVVLVPKTGVDTGNPANASGEQPQPGAMQAGNIPQQPMQDAADATDADATDDSADENAEQPEAAEQQQNNNPDQSGVKTPQQMLQEMQQRQLQMQQQQQNPGQAPIAPPGRSPQEPQQQ